MDIDKLKELLEDLRDLKSDMRGMEAYLKVASRNLHWPNDAMGVRADEARYRLNTAAYAVMLLGDQVLATIDGIERKE